MGRVDPVALKILEGAVAKRIVAEICHHDDFGAKFRRGDRLIGALAAKARFEAAAKHCLTPDRHALDRGRQIHVGRPDHSDARTLRHSVPFLESRQLIEVASASKRENRSEEIGDRTRGFLTRFRVAAQGDAAFGAGLELCGGVCAPSRFVRLSAS
jgi:hypothetical protein